MNLYKLLLDNQCQSVQNHLTTPEDWKAFISKKVLNTPNFWNLDLKNAPIESTLKKLLLNLQKLEIQHQQKYMTFFKSFSKQELLKIISCELELDIAFEKSREDWSVKHHHVTEESVQLIRQLDMVQLIGLVIQRIIEQYLPVLNDTSTQTIPSKQQLQTLHTACNDLKEIFTAQHVIDFYLSDLWTIDTSGKSWKMTPIKGKEFEANQLCVNFHFTRKYRCLYNAAQSMLRARIPVYLNFFKSSALKKRRNFDALIAGTNMEAIKIGIEALGHSFSDYLVFELLGLDFENFPMLQLDNGTALDILEVLEVTSFLKVISERSVISLKEKITTTMDRYHMEFKLLSTENFQLLTKVKQLLNKATSVTEKDKLIQALETTPLFQEYRNYVIDNSKEHCISKETLLKYNLQELVQFIHTGTGILPQNIHYILNFFTYKKNSSLLSQPFIQIEDSITWIPSTVAYHNFVESMLSVYINENKSNLHTFQTDFFENGLTKIFKKHGYKVINKNEDKIIKKNGKILSDFDTLAYKDGILFNFEIKLNSKQRSSSFEKQIWYDRALTKAASKQIPRQRIYIKEHKKEIASILGLSSSDKITAIHSFIVSNSYDFNHYNIPNKGTEDTTHSFLKINFYDLIYLLQDWDARLYTEEEHLRLTLRKIEREGKHYVSTHFREWANGNAPKPSAKEYQLCKKFIKAHHPANWSNNKERPPLKLLEHIHKNTLFNYLDYEIKIVHQIFKVGSIQIQMPKAIYPVI